MTQNLYCPHNRTCEIYQSMPQSEKFPIRLDIIEIDSTNRYRCLAFHTAKGLKRRETGEQCSHIEILNLISHAIPSKVFAGDI